MRLWVSCLALMCCLAVSAGESTSPQQTVENYFELFNNRDRVGLNEASGQPFVFIMAGEATAHPQYGDAVDFDGLAASGWAYSRIHKNELIYADDMTAMVAINFSRYDNADNPLSTTDVVYLLVLREDGWKLKGGFVDKNLSLGKQE